MGVTIVSTVVVFSLLVYVHELGHYLAAKCAGIRVVEFGFGYPPRIAVLFRRGDTEYTLNAIPVGGFVRMAGMPGDENPSEPGGFSSKGRGARVFSLLAGSLMNVLLAVALFSAVSVLGEPVDVESLSVTQVVGQSPAYHAGINFGDRIVRINGQPVRSFYELSRVTQDSIGRPMAITVNRAGLKVTVSLIPRANPPEGEGPMGVGIQATWMRTEFVRYPLLQAVARGFWRTGETLADIYEGLKRAVRSFLEPESQSALTLTGPVGIGMIVGEVAQSGQESVLTRMMLLTAILSVNLCLINLLPFPALDGGRLLFILVEWLRGGKRVDPRREGYVHLVGIALILGAFVVVSYLDFTRWTLR